MILAPKRHINVALVVLVLFGWTGTGVVCAEELPQLIFEHFNEASSLERWKTSDIERSRSVWKLDQGTESTDANQFLRVTGKSEFEPPFRSPHSYALVKDLIVDNFELTVRLQNTNRDAGAHRDLCLFFGFQDPSHYYYVHFGAVADPHACQIFIVNGAPRTKITVQEATGTPWDDNWHTVKLIRDIENGRIEVFFDNLSKAFMTAQDTTFLWGQVGVGTFDDHGNFDDFELRGRRAARP